MGIKIIGHEGTKGTKSFLLNKGGYTPMRNESRSTRRKFIRNSVASTAAISLPWIIPSRALGEGGAAAPSERVTLGVIGVGPRCRYVLPGMLGQPDVQCVAIADVQASRRRAAKRFVDNTTATRIAFCIVTSANCSSEKTSTRCSSPREIVGMLQRR
jgi:hypothetical protein